MSKMSYRSRDPRRGKTRKVSFSVSESTIEGLDKIRNAFRLKYPTAQFPTLSSVLEKVLTKNLELFEREPGELAKAVQEFEKKYPQGTKPAPFTEVES